MACRPLVAALTDISNVDTSGNVAERSHKQTMMFLGMQDSEQDRSAYPPVRWPMVRTHPGSGRKVLRVDNKVTEISGMSVPEGRALAHELLEHIGQRERVYSHAWTPNDVVMWDNRSVLHRGRRFDLAERREMRRVSTIDDSSSLGEVLPEGAVRRTVNGPEID